MIAVIGWIIFWVVFSAFVYIALGTVYIYMERAADAVGGWGILAFRVIVGILAIPAVVYLTIGYAFFCGWIGSQMGFGL